MSYNPRRSLTTVRDGLSRLISQFQNKPILAAELTSFLARCQEVEDCLWAIILGRSLVAVASPGGVTLTPAQGAQLDVIGKIVGCSRAGLADADYIVALLAQVYVNRSSGVPENFLHLLKISSPAGAAWTILEYYPATVHVQITTIESWALAVTWRYLRLVKAAGVRLLLTSSVAAPLSTFTPYSVTGAAPMTATGYNSTTGSAVPGAYASTLGV